MNYLKKLNERWFTFKIEKLIKDGGEPIVVKLSKPILYEEDAYSVLQYYVGLFAQTPLPEGTYNRESNLLRLVCGHNNDNNLYWLYRRDGLYFTIRIGFKSKLFIGRTIYVPYEEVEQTYLKIPVKDCGRDFMAPARIYGHFIYSKKGIKPIALMFETEGLNSKIAYVWGAKVDYNEKDTNFKGYDSYGIKGEWYDIWFSPSSPQPIYKKEDSKRVPVDSHERWWRSEKIIHQFDEKERPSMLDMLTIWKIFQESI